MQKGTCSAKSVAKFCLVYVITLLVLTLVFTAFSNEPMEEAQVGWWWGFLCSLIFSASVSVVALVVLIYTDYHTADSLEQADIDQSAGYQKPTEPVNSSMRTVLTINSVSNQNDQQALKNTFEAQTTTNDIANASFVNLTPQKNAVTVVDLSGRSIRRKRDDALRATSRVEDSPAASVTEINKRKKHKSDKTKTHRRK